jgi:hypothetical protein
VLSREGGDGGLLGLVAPLELDDLALVPLDLLLPLRHLGAELVDLALGAVALDGDEALGGALLEIRRVGGAEVELVYTPTDPLRLEATLGLLDTEISSDFLSAGPGPLSQRGPRGCDRR